MVVPVLTLWYGPATTPAATLAGMFGTACSVQSLQHACHKLILCVQQQNQQTIWLAGTMPAEPYLQICIPARRNYESALLQQQSEPAALGSEVITQIWQKDVCSRSGCLATHWPGLKHAQQLPC